jgi:hypothetical protein
MNQTATAPVLATHEPPVDDNIHYSAYRQTMIEDAFVNAVQRHFWLKGHERVDVLRSRVNDCGYSIVLEAKGVTRHIKFVSTGRNAKRSTVDVNRALESKPSGCVVWVYFDPETLGLGPFYYLGKAPGEALMPLYRLKHAVRSTPNADGDKPPRPNLKDVGKTYFDRVDTLEELIVKLFG